jgi:K+-transporting ATPase ATPase C chain
MFSTLRHSLAVFLLLTLLCGGVYPLACTLLAQAFFPHAANGSLILREGKTLGSALIGQNFSDPRYFWGRLSATSPQAYNASSSSGSNFSMNNPALLDAAKARLEALRQADPGNARIVPVDLVTASGSGLDPDISPAAAAYQIPRIARARHLPEETLRAMVGRATEGRQFGLLGEPRVNVLRLNLLLDGKF